ncbi:poly polymerase protein [Apiospora marii]|uniref:Poly polymerase protein n=1 Tax=Apiospora marii TaxID=335849 RepID=A0ABR1SGW8_9PEZI
MLTLVLDADSAAQIQTPGRATPRQIYPAIFWSLSSPKNPLPGKKPLSKAEFITDSLLTQHLRPLFSKSRPATVNPSGRKAAFVEEQPSTVLEDRATKPWKYAHVYAVTVFEWAVTNAANSTTTTSPSSSKQAPGGDAAAVVPLLSKTWHLFTPVLLTLLDESETALKIRAMGIFGAFWSGCPPGLMDQVGLASVFEDAVFPAVHFLPNITPEDESRRILDAAYPALFQLAGLTAVPEGEESTNVLTNPQRKLLDRIIREGILRGYFHAKNHIQLTAVFCDKLSYAVNGMGILSVKYLKDILPMISEIMTNPFGTKHTPSLLASIHLLQAVLRCCWPRILGYQNEIIRILTVCWLNIADEDTWSTSDNTAPKKEDLEAQLTKAAAMLSSIIHNNSQQEQDQPAILLDDLVSPLIKKEPLLAPLFTSLHHNSTSSPVN